MCFFPSVITLCINLFKRIYEVILVHRDPFLLVISITESNIPVFRMPLAVSLVHHTKESGLSSCVWMFEYLSFAIIFLMHVSHGHTDQRIHKTVPSFNVWVSRSWLFFRRWWWWRWRLSRESRDQGGLGWRGDGGVVTSSVFTNKPPKPKQICPFDSGAQGLPGATSQHPVDAKTWPSSLFLLYTSWDKIFSRGDNYEWLIVIRV